MIYFEFHNLILY